ncbi:unnamed protein product, partial [Adineta steineri]
MEAKREFQYVDKALYGITKTNILMVDLDEALDDGIYPNDLMMQAKETFDWLIFIRCFMVDVRQALN